MRVAWGAIGAAVTTAGLIGAIVFADALPARAPVAAEPYVGSVTPDRQPVACPGQVSIPVGEIESGDAALDSGSDDVAYDAVGAERVGAGAGFFTLALAGASAERVGGGDVAGLAAAQCTLPQREQWLVGGSTALGSSSRLVLTNPTEASTEVTVSYYGPLGLLDERTVVSVAAGAQHDLLLEGVVAETAALVVKVSATGAGVSAALQDSRLDGFQPAGTDWVGPSSTPAQSLVIAGVGGAAEGTETLVRMLAPEGATVTLGLITADGPVEWGGVTALALEPGVVTEIPVPASSSGAITIASDQPVTAAAMIRVPRDVVDGPANAQAWDLAWAPAQDTGDGMPRSVAVTAHAVAVVAHAVTPGEFTLTDASGETVASAVLAGGETTVLSLEVEPGTVLTAPGGFAWEVVLEDQPGFIARLTPQRTDVEPLAVEVRHGAYVERMDDAQVP